MGRQPLGFNSGFDLVFEDDFDGASLDLTNWDYYPYGTTNAVPLDANLTVANSIAYAEMKEEVPPVGGKDYSYSGLLGLKTFDMCYMEARINFPPVIGWNLAFWTSCFPLPAAPFLPTMIEIDTFESFCEDEVTSTHGAGGFAHDGVGYIALGGKQLPTTYGEFVVYGVMITRGVINFYLDGRRAHSKYYDPTALYPGRGWIVIVSTSSGSTYTVDPDTLPASIAVDWVRVYNIQVPQTLRRMQI